MGYKPTTPEILESCDLQAYNTTSLGPIASIRKQRKYVLMLEVYVFE